MKISKKQERAFISTYQNLGYIKNDKLVVLKPKQQISTYNILDYNNGTYQDIPNDEKLVNEAIDWYQGASYLFTNRLYNKISK